MNPTASAVKFREYERIFTGSNQDAGYTNPILGFTGDTVLQVFPPDLVTYFHYPYTAPTTLLSDSTLVIDGAICGVSPHFSDKIWKKQANYSNSSLWGTSQPVGKQSGVWLCSWLSGNVSDPDVKPVWKDRWYNPGYIDSNTAMFITNPASGIILDIDTEMLLDGGSYYKYFHVGNQHNETMVSLLTTNSALKLRLDDWSITPEDLSLYKNTTTILNFTSAGTVSLNGVNVVERPDDNCLSLNGINQYAQVLHSENYTLTGNMTCSFWAFTPDWANMNSHCIISKDYRGGWSTKYNNGFFNPYMVFIGDAGKVVIMNIEGHVVDSKTLPQPSMPTSLTIDSNDYIWVADNLAKCVYKMDVNGDLVDSINFDSTVDLQKIDLDDVGNICVLDTNTSRISAFNIFSNEFIGVKSGLFYEAYKGNGSYMNGHYESPYTVSGNALVHSGYFDFSGASLQEIRLSNSIKSSNINPNGIADWVMNTSGLWLGQTTQYEDYGLTWSGKLQVPVNGNYTFRTYGDDYLKLSANNVMIASSYYVDNQVETTYYFDASSTYDIRVEMGEWISLDYFNLDWKNTALPSMSAYENFGSSTYLTPNGSGINNFTIDLNGAVVGYNCKELCVDNDNAQWVLNNNKLYKNSELVALPVTATNIACDKDNNIWVLFDTNAFLKIDTTNFETTSGTIGSNVSATDRAINFTYEYTDGAWGTFAYFTFANEQLIYKTDANGNLVKTINLNIFDTYPTLSTFTSYDCNRKFNYNKIGKQPQIQTEIVIIDNSNNITRETLYIPSSSVANNNWHMFTFTVENGSAKFYMDALLRDTVNFSTDNRIYYEYENPLLIGMDVGKITSLADEYGLKSLYFKGRIDDLRIYDTTLNNSDIRYIYLSKFDYHSLNWNMDSGNQNYLEEIARFFKFKLPGLKSQYYNIRISGLGIEDTSVREMIENIIKTNLKKIVPAYAELFKIIWE